MKAYILLLLAYFLSCQKEADKDTVCFSLSERQCAMDPYQSYIKSVDLTRPKAIASWLSVQGISGAVVSENEPFTGAVCLACTCPSGISYTVSVFSTDTLKLKKLDLLLTKTDCKLKLYGFP